jgi:hypothetical protein
MIGMGERKRDISREGEKHSFIAFFHEIPSPGGVGGET